MCVCVCRNGGEENGKEGGKCDKETTTITNAGKLIEYRRPPCKIAQTKRKNIRENQKEDKYPPKMTKKRNDKQRKTDENAKVRTTLLTISPQ